MYKLIGVDFDGTLLDDNKNVSEENKKVLIECRNNGYIVVGVTGRTIESVKNVVDINIFDYLILNNGATIYNVQGKKIISERVIDKNDAKEITEIVEKGSYQIDYCTFHNYYIYKNDKKRDRPFLININSIEEVEESISKINIFLSNKDIIEKIKKELQIMYKRLNIIIMQDSGNDKKWIVITPIKTSKLDALKELGSIININLKDMIFFGDGLNDVETIEKVGLGVSMGNALEEVQEKSKDITISNNESGIAYYLKEKILKRH